VKLSNKARYGTRALFDMAYHGQSAPAQVHDVARRQSIPQRFLEQIFQDLRRARLVTSKRGPQGGYTLARPADKISVGAVVRAVQGPITLDDDRDGPAERGTPVDARLIEQLWKSLSEQVNAVLDTVTIGDLCRRAEHERLERRPAQGYTYSI
jgi:Rrf2 family protein